ncbi:MAG: hypothetical protein EBR82_70250 [Caulobacteraceae bacterium]|nr:hypothetical protein [Caulobacteraceae bacterium]
MGRQLNQIIEGLAGVTSGTSTINVNLDAIEALLTTLQADIADGIIVSSGTANTNLRDGSGNAITSSTVGTTRRLDVNLSSAGTTGSSTPTIANLYAGTDGTSLRPISTDVNGRVNVNQVRGTTTIGTLTAGTTNGTLFATNSTRNYLLVQCTSGTAFIDTNGTASTANGIQLTSGQGITFEGSFIPTGAIAAITSTGTAQLIGRQG